MNFLKDLFFLEGDEFSGEGGIASIFSMEQEDETAEGEKYPKQLPILVVRNTVLFPGVIIPINVGRPRSLEAIQKAYQMEGRYVAVLAQTESSIERPELDDIYRVGTIARILKIIHLPDGSSTAVLQGRRRFRLVELTKEIPYLEGKIVPLPHEKVKNKVMLKAMVSSILDEMAEIVELSPHIPPEAMAMLQNITNHRFLLNFLASNFVDVKVAEKQALLEMNELEAKAKRILEALRNQLQVLEIKDQIESKVRSDIEKQQRDYFLNQQLKTIQEELGQDPQTEAVQRLRERAEKKDWPEYVAKHFERELNRLLRMNPQIPDYSIQLNYLEFILDLPWNTYSQDNFDLRKVKEVLDSDHYGLEKVKERILEHLAVLKLKGDMKAPILCLVGPPGVGKTSLGRSVARALNRSFIRMSLGGLHDESEIRGHRKTYIGAMPGRILQSIKKAGTSNPVFILDEIDKVGKTFRGDPSSALLEVLDPEQNTSFYDNYLELEYDLSKVLFIATANSLGSIQPALRDRMEIIWISGYSTEEKVQIARRHLIPKQRENHGLKAKQVNITTPAIRAIIRSYTRESGVRSLDRLIAAVMRYVAKKVAMKESYDKSVKPQHLKEILGAPRYINDEYIAIEEPGVAIGLAWTSVGGEVFVIEVSLSKGRGRLTLTGNLGNVMKESATTALSYLKAHCDELDIPYELFDKRDIHIHIPEGAIPKEGPSAGIALLTALTSAFTGRKLRPYVAMTGEITLLGRVLPVGGIKEKILAAKRSGIKEVILCKENQKDIEEIKPEYIKGVKFHYVERAEEVLALALRKRRGRRKKKADTTKKEK